MRSLPLIIVLAHINETIGLVRGHRFNGLSQTKALFRTNSLRLRVWSDCKILVTNVHPNFVEIRLWTHRTVYGKINKVNTINFLLHAVVTGVSIGENRTSARYLISSHPPTYPNAGPDTDVVPVNEHTARTPARWIQLAS